MANDGQLQIAGDTLSISAKLPSYTGVDSENPGRPEIEHYGNCPVCGALVDMCDLGQVMEHTHGQVPLDLTGRPDPDLQ